MANNLTDFFARLLKQQKEANTWPPTSEIKRHWLEIDGYRRRYRNDRNELIQSNPNISIDQHKVEIFTPVPWPRELCRFSASLLFSETPKVTSEKYTTLVEALEEVNDFGAFAIRGGVKVAKDGRIAIRVIQDEDISDKPLLTLVEEDALMWDIRHGSFYMGGVVVIEREGDRITTGKKDDDKIVYRLLESHSKGLVTRQLYRGTRTELGDKKPLATLDEFADLDDEWETHLNAPTLIPWENVPGAESDLFGLGPVFDVINEAESLLLDRGRKATPRVFVDRSLADESGRLEIDGYMLTGSARLRPQLGATPGELIHTVQPDFASEEHIKWNDHLTQLMVTVAGYAPLTWGIQGNTATIQRAVSGYAMKLAQLRTLLNRSGKEHMALQAMGWGFATAIAMSEGIEDVSSCLPEIELGDGLPPDPLDGAQEVLWLRQAMAASTGTLVETVHPTWTPDQVDDEVQAIEEMGQFPQGGAQSQGVGPLGSAVKGLLRGTTGSSRARAGGGVDPGAVPIDSNS